MSQVITITHSENESRGRYEARIEGCEGSGELTYSRLSPTKIIADHTGVDDSLRARALPGRWSNGWSTMPAGTAPGSCRSARTYGRSSSATRTGPTSWRRNSHRHRCPILTAAESDTATAPRNREPHVRVGHRRIPAGRIVRILEYHEPASLATRFGRGQEDGLEVLHSLVLRVFTAVVSRVCAAGANHHDADCYEKLGHGSVHLMYIHCTSLDYFFYRSLSDRLATRSRRDVENGTRIPQVVAQVTDLYRAQEIRGTQQLHAPDTRPEPAVGGRVWNRQARRWPCVQRHPAAGIKFD